MKHSDYYHQGHERGSDIADYVYHERGDEYSSKDTFIEECQLTEDNDRQFTPFEFTARGLSIAGEWAWDDFDEGIIDGINAIADKFYPE